ncbi:hypothetical protein J6590_085049 [Homalodisca vitripennis]|nr:hypothetical protein J6590_085049 [Homalodisca vitripennis]
MNFWESGAPFILRSFVNLNVGEGWIAPGLSLTEVVFKVTRTAGVPLIRRIILKISHRVDTVGKECVVDIEENTNTIHIVGWGKEGGLGVKRNPDLSKAQYELENEM